MFGGHLAFPQVHSKILASCKKMSSGFIGNTVLTEEASSTLCGRGFIAPRAEASSLSETRENSVFLGEEVADHGVSVLVSQASVFCLVVKMARELNKLRCRMLCLSPA